MSGYLAEALRHYEHAAATGKNAKHTMILFGVAAITADAARADSGRSLPEKIETEEEQFIALIYAIRCAPAHDISEPVWKLRERYRRAYDVAGIRVDLTGVDGLQFEIDHIGGHQTLPTLVGYGYQTEWLTHQ